MNRINVLEQKVSELIAAGEVVERPASVVKELVENSIDAGSNKITIEIEKGGIKFIRISDNGCGINRADIKKAFLRHATSKISTEEDLYKIGTLGFRGEALFAISAVSKIELITMSKDEKIGTKYILNDEDGKIEDCGCSQGTIFTVRDLFYNVPARKKFLRKDIWEANTIAGLIDKIALSHPEISFKLVKDGKTILHTVGDNKISSCIYSVYGKQFFEGMTSVNYENNGINVTGYVSIPIYSRSNRSMQHFFINGRYIKSKLAMNALEEAFKGTIMVEKHPYCVLYLKTPLDIVDVNVHPAKIEVKFSDEKVIFDTIYNAVKSALSNKDKIKNLGDSKSSITTNDVFFNTSNSVTKSLDVKNDDSTQNMKSIIENDLQNNSKQVDLIIEPVKIEPRDAYNKFSNDKKKEEKVDISNFINNRKSDNLPENLKKVEVKEVIEKQDNFISNLKSVSGKKENDVLEISKDSGEAKKNLLEETSNLKVIGEAFNCFIILQKSNEQLIIIDKHAAHERILYEELKNSKNGIESQILLDPINIVLEKKEYAIVLDNIATFSKFGYKVEDFGLGTIIVRSAPSYIPQDEIANSVIEIADHIMKNKNILDTNYSEWLYHTIACRSAIKAGTPSSTEEILDLVNKLKLHPNLMYCPHGRPIYISMTKSYIEKQFGRT